MTIASESIITLYEVNNLTPQEIAEVEGLGVVEVKQLLAQYSKLYRERLASSKYEGSVSQEKVTEDEMLQIMINLAQTAENESVKLSAAKYVRDELKGRNDTNAGSGAAELQGLNLLNAALRKARKVNQLKAPSEPEVEDEVEGEMIEAEVIVKEASK